MGKVPKVLHGFIDRPVVHLEVLGSDEEYWDKLTEGVRRGVGLWVRVVKGLDVTGGLKSLCWLS